ncbi:MAG TPA: alpha/beta hydrolase-fold protein, partial [Gaiellaceae bacterium]
MEPWSKELAGRLDEHELDSAALAGNPLGDPSRRPVWVYEPPGAEGATLPAVYLIQGFTGQIDMWRNRSPLRPTVLELVDELRAPARVVFVDAWTSYGGSQFVDSPAVGNYHTYLCDDVVGFVDERYPTSARAIAGKSSGGYGAMVTAMLRPDVFSGLATHAGDALFELCYLTEFPQVVRALRDGYDGSYDAFWEDFRSRPAFTKPADPVLINTFAMAQCYSNGELPFDVATVQLKDDVWERWLAWDPVRLAAAHGGALAGLRGIWIDAGRDDEYRLDLAAVAFRDAVVTAG